MFVKVSVSYGSGSRSYPLDLLLYDSQCWHCAYTGECNAKAGILHTLPLKTVIKLFTECTTIYYFGFEISSEFPYFMRVHVKGIVS
jgi:hypothetical protein